VKLSSDSFRSFHEALCDAFVSVDALRTMVRQRLEADLNDIASNAPKPQVVMQLLEWAEGHDQVNELLAGAQAERPDNEKLKQVEIHAQAERPDNQKLQQIDTSIDLFLQRGQDTILPPRPWRKLLVVAVVILGFVLVLVPNRSAFSVTVFVHGEHGRQDVVLHNQGSIVLDLGANRRKEPIGDKGQAYFPGIPAKFRGQIVKVSVDADGYEVVPGAEHGIKLDGESLYIGVRALALQLSGFVRDTNGDPVEGATVSFAGHTKPTEKDGSFVLRNIAKEEDHGEMQVTASGFRTWHASVSAANGTVDVQLKKAE
jgi:hypothetical protein